MIPITLRQQKLRLWLLLSLLASATSWLYVSSILAPWESYICESYLDLEHGRLIAQMGDLYPRWVGTRELLLHGRNPYGPEVSHKIQIGFYGHVIEQRYGQSGAIVLDEQRFAYPVYVVFLLAPTVWMDFSHLQMGAPVIFATLTAISVLLWLDVLHWRPPRTLTGAIILFVLSSPQIAQGLRLRQLGLVVAFLLALSAWCIARNHLAIAGMVLAVSTVKPQMVVLPVAWFLIWSLSACGKRWPLLAGFGVTLSALVGMGQLILPGWPRYFLDGIVAYRKYFPTTSILCFALGDWAGGTLSVLAIVGILLLAWRNRKTDASSLEFVQTLAVFFVGASLVLPLLTPFNQALLLLPTLMIIRDWAALPRAMRRVFAVIVAWPSVASLALLLLNPRLDSPDRFPLLPSAMVLFVPPILSLLLAARLSRTAQSSLHVDLPVLQDQ